LVDFDTILQDNTSVQMRSGSYLRNMILYLVRHGIAEDTSASGRDADRRLTQKGTLRTAMVAKAVHRLGVSFDRIVSSPYRRAWQTAEIFARITGHDHDIVSDERLVPFVRFEDVCDLVLEHSDVGTMLFAGHQPSMGEIISGLVADSRLEIDVKKASVTCVDIHRMRPRPAGTLLWSVPPRVFEPLAG
jgi:phosphohistidine phosphatase